MCQIISIKSVPNETIDNFVTSFMKKRPDSKFIVISKNHVDSIHYCASKQRSRSFTKICVRGTENKKLESAVKNGENIIAGPSFFKGAKFTSAVKKALLDNNYFLIFENINPSPYGVGKKIFHMTDKMLVIDNTRKGNMNRYMEEKGIAFEMYKYVQRSSYYGPIEYHFEKRR